MEPNKPNEDPSKPSPGAISRRDFLRRAGTEAAKTGTRLMPGAALAQKALGIGDDDPKTLDGQPAKRGLLQKLIDWRGSRGKAEGE